MKKYALLALLLCLALCLPGLAAAEDAKLMLDIVWVVDCTGSMPNNINNIKDQLAKFASKLTDFDVQYGLVGFGDETNDKPPKEPTVKIQWDGSEWTRSISALQKSMGSGGLPSYSGDDDPETPTCGLYMAATEYAWRENAVHAIVLVADYDYKTQGTSVVTGKAIPSMEECLDACSEKNISINLLNCGTTTAYDNAVTQSGGVAGRTNDGFSTAVEQLAHGIHNTPVVITQPEDLYLHDDDIVYLTAETVKGRDTWFSWYYVNRYGYSEGLIGYVPTSDGIARYRLRADSYMDGREYYCVFSNSRWGATGDTRSIETRHAILHVASKFAITGQPQDVTIEAGQTATFTVVATGDGLTYQWQKKSGDTWVDLSGETAATLSIPATLADDGSEYRCVIKDAISDKQPSGYTLTSDSAALTVVAAPAIITDPKDVTTESGKTATFTVQATGNGITYQWQKQSGSIWDDLPGETGASLTVLASLEISGSMYRCQVTSGYGTVVTSQPAKLMILGAPAIITDPKDVTTESGKTATFTVQATGDGITYQWQKQSGSIWADLSGETGASLTVPASLENNGSVYRCQVTSSFGTVAVSQPAKLTVVAAPVITVQPESITITEGEDASFTVTATGEGLKYQWQVYRNGVWMNCTDGHTPTLTLSSPALTDDGQLYRCKITSSYGTEITSDVATLTVLAKIELPQTGDSFQPWLWAVLLGASLLGLTMLRRRRA